MEELGRIQLVREGDRGALRALFSEHIQFVYANARVHTGSEDAAKDTLKKTLILAQERCADCPDEALPWLCSLCDEVLGIQPEEAAEAVLEEVLTAEPAEEPEAPIEEPAEEPEAEEGSTEEYAEEEASVENPAGEAPLAVENPEEPVEEAADYPQEETEASDEETVSETNDETIPEEEFETVAAADTVSCVRRVKMPTPKYDMAQDEWLQKLREEKRRALHEEASILETPVEIPEKKPTAVENPVETEDFFPEKKQKMGAFGKIMIVLLIVVILLLAWATLGLLMNMGKLPFIDLGYSWFNAHIMDMF